MRCHWFRLACLPQVGPRVFAGSPRPTLGVEWEFALVDSQTRDLSNEATAVIAEIGENPRVHKLLRSTRRDCQRYLQTPPRQCRICAVLIYQSVVRDRGVELFCAVPPPSRGGRPRSSPTRRGTRADQTPVVGPADADHKVYTCMSGFARRTK